MQRLLCGFHVEYQQTFASIFGGCIYQTFMPTVLNCSSGWSLHCYTIDIQSCTEA